MHRVRSESATAAALRADREDSATDLAAGDVTRLRILAVHVDHHQHRRAGNEGRQKCTYLSLSTARRLINM